MHLIKYIPPLLIAPLLVFSVWVGHSSQNNFSLQNESSFASFLPEPCPTENRKNRSILIEFLTEPHWALERQETNTSNLDTSQIKILQSPNNNSICEQFNNQYTEAFTEEWKSGGKKYDVTYFKVSDYFFVLISLRGPEDPNVAGTGADFLHVYNKSISLIEAYAF